MLLITKYINGKITLNEFIEHLKEDKGINAELDLIKEEIQKLKDHSNQQGEDYTRLYLEWLELKHKL